jgi:hypothetical protein
MTFWEKLELLEQANGTIEKEDVIIKLLKEYPEAEEFFRLACGNTVFNLAEKSFYNAFDVEVSKDYEHVSDYLKNEIVFKPTAIPGGYTWKDMQKFAIEMETASGSDQLNKIYNFFIQLEDLKRKWFCRALLHDLRCGVKRKTNK